MMSKKAAVALSGGIDSSVTALLLLKQGYDVVGVSAKMTDTAESDNVIKNAKAVADILEIPFFPFDATHIFKEKVVNYFKDSYKQGLTPNPCIMCNKYIKWGVLFDYAIKELNADIIATGHYADIKENGGFYKLYPASDEHKDQLYFLFLLNQEQLKRTVFPNRDLKMTSRRAADADFFNFLHAFTSSSSKFRFSPAVQSAVSAAGRFTAIISAGLTQRSFFRRITLSPALTTSSAAEATIFGRM